MLLLCSFTASVRVRSVSSHITLKSSAHMRYDLIINSARERVNLLRIIKAVVCLNTDRSHRSFQCQFQFLNSLLCPLQNHPVVLSLSLPWPSVSPIFTVRYDNTFVVTSEKELISPLAPSSSMLCCFLTGPA